MEAAAVKSDPVTLSLLENQKCCNPLFLNNYTTEAEILCQILDILSSHQNPRICTDLGPARCKILRRDSLAQAGLSGTLKTWDSSLIICKLARLRAAWPVPVPVKSATTSNEINKYLRKIKINLQSITLQVCFLSNREATRCGYEIS